eukprot:m.107348 g.107348  ORF g.107348 m.107348 type:complete len:72 (+) comp13925_c0_seq1:6130-6345(+)
MFPFLLATASKRWAGSNATAIGFLLRPPWATGAENVGFPWPLVGGLGLTGAFETTGFFEFGQNGMMSQRVQ